MTTVANRRVIRSPRGTTLNTKSWQTEAPLRLLMNNLDPDVAERPEELVVPCAVGPSFQSGEPHSVDDWRS